MKYVCTFVCKCICSHMQYLYMCKLCLQISIHQMCSHKEKKVTLAVLCIVSL